MNHITILRKLECHQEDKGIWSSILDSKLVLVETVKTDDFVADEGAPAERLPSIVTLSTEHPCKRIPMFHWSSDGLSNNQIKTTHNP